MKTNLNRLMIVLLLLTSTQTLAKGDADAGAAKVMVCAGCHGVDGNSMVPAFPKLAALGEKYLFQQLRYALQEQQHCIMLL